MATTQTPANIQQQIINSLNSLKQYFSNSLDSYDKKMTVLNNAIAPYYYVDYSFGTSSSNNIGLEKHKGCQNWWVCSTSTVSSFMRRPVTTTLKVCNDNGKGQTNCVTTTTVVITAIIQAINNSSTNNPIPQPTPTIPTTPISSGATIVSNNQGGVTVTHTNGQIQNLFFANGKTYTS